MELDLQKILFDPTVGKIVGLLVGAAVISVIGRLVKRAVGGRIADSTARYRFRKVITFANFLLVLLLASVIFASRLGGLTVAFGVAGAGIAFALQEVIVSFAGWIALMFGNFYGVGDRVQLGGIKGDVIDIGVLRTTLMELGGWVQGDQYNGRIVRIANSFVFKEPVFNYSADFGFVWDEIKVPVRYGSDHKMAREMIVRVADDVVRDFVPGAKADWSVMVQKYAIEDASVEPVIFVVANDNWIEFTLRYVVDFKRRRITKDQLFTRILEEVDASKGKVQLASATFELTALPPLRIEGGKVP